MVFFEGRKDDRPVPGGTYAKHVTDALRYVSQRRWNASRAALLRGWEIAKSDGDLRGRALCCRMLTELHRRLGDSLSARQFLQLALDAESLAWGPDCCEFSREALISAARDHQANGEDEDAFRLLQAAAARVDLRE